MLSKKRHEDERRISFGKCQLPEIHNFWGRYAIISMVETPEEEENPFKHHLFWIETVFLKVPLRQLQAAYQARLLHPFFILHSS